MYFHLLHFFHAIFFFVCRLPLLLDIAILWWQFFADYLNASNRDQLYLHFSLSLVLNSPPLWNWLFVSLSSCMFGATLDVHVYSLEVKNHLAARKIYYAIQSYTEFQVICLVATAIARTKRTNNQCNNTNTHKRNDNSATQRKRRQNASVGGVVATSITVLQLPLVIRAHKNCKTNEQKKTRTILEKSFQLWPLPLQMHKSRNSKMKTPKSCKL